MKVFTAIFTLLVLIGISFVSSIPAPKFEEADFDGVISPIEGTLAATYETEHGSRFARATCDLLSMSTPWGSANHSICAAHCLAMMKGYRGGRCIDGVCNCRR